MYESKGEATTTSIKFSRDVKSAYIVDMTEDNEKEADLDLIEFRGYEIITLKVEM